METSITYTVTPLSGGSSLVQTSEKAMFVLPAGTQELVTKERRAYLQEIGVWKQREADQQAHDGNAAAVSVSDRTCEDDVEQLHATHLIQHGSPSESAAKQDITLPGLDLTVVPSVEAAQSSSPSSANGGHKRSHSFSVYFIQKLQHVFGTKRPVGNKQHGGGALILKLPSEIMAMITSHLVENVEFPHSRYHDNLVIKNNALGCARDCEALTGLQSLSLASKHLSVEVRCNLLNSAAFHYTIEGQLSEQNERDLIWSGIEALPTEINDQRHGSRAKKSTIHPKALVLNIKCDATAAITSGASLNSLCKRIKLCTDTKDLIIRWNVRGDNWYQEDTEDKDSLRSVKEALQAAVEQMRSIQRYHTQVERFAGFAAREGAPDWTGEHIYRVDSDNNDYWMGDAKLTELKWELHVER